MKSFKRKPHHQALLLGLACVWGISSCSSPEIASSQQVRNYPKQMKAQARTDVLVVGDTLEIFVMEDQAFNGIYKIREKGDIIFPKLGRVVVAGLTVDAAQQKIQQALQGTQLQNATVIADRISQVPGVANFEEKPKILVFVTGKVNRPGQHMIAIASGDTVYAYEAVLIAGGVTQFADEKHAYILRKGDRGARDKIPLNLRSIRQGQESDKALADGDMICVPERRFAL